MAKVIMKYRKTDPMLSGDARCCTSRSTSCTSMSCTNAVSTTISDISIESYDQTSNVSMSYIGLSSMTLSNSEVVLNTNSEESMNTRCNTVSESCSEESTSKISEPARKMTIPNEFAIYTLQRLSHAPFIQTSTGRWVVLSDVREILMWCPNPHCMVVLNALKCLLEYPETEEKMHPCTQKEHLLFLKQFEIIHSGTLLVKIDALIDYEIILTLHYMVKCKHQKSQDPNTVNCRKLLNEVINEYSNTSFKLPAKSLRNRTFMPGVRNRGRPNSDTNYHTNCVDTPMHPLVQLDSVSKNRNEADQSLIPLSQLDDMVPGSTSFLRNSIELFLLGRCNQEKLGSMRYCDVMEGIHLTRFLTSQFGYSDRDWKCVTSNSLLMSWSDFWAGRNRSKGGVLLFSHSLNFSLVTLDFKDIPRWKHLNRIEKGDITRHKNLEAVSRSLSKSASLTNLDRMAKNVDKSCTKHVTYIRPFSAKTVSTSSETTYPICHCSHHIYDDNGRMVCKKVNCLDGYSRSQATTEEVFRSTRLGSATDKSKSPTKVKTKKKARKVKSAHKGKSSDSKSLLGDPEQEREDGVGKVMSKVGLKSPTKVKTKKRVRKVKSAPNKGKSSQSQSTTSGSNIDAMSIDTLVSHEKEGLPKLVKTTRSRICSALNRGGVGKQTEHRRQTRSRKWQRDDEVSADEERSVVTDPNVNNCATKQDLSNEDSAISAKALPQIFDSTNLDTNSSANPGSGDSYNHKQRIKKKRRKSASPCHGQIISLSPIERVDKESYECFQNTAARYDHKPCSARSKDLLVDGDYSLEETISSMTLSDQSDSVRCSLAEDGDNMNQLAELLEIQTISEQAANSTTAAAVEEHTWRDIVTNSSGSDQEYSCPNGLDSKNPEPNVYRKLNTGHYSEHKCIKIGSGKIDDNIPSNLRKALNMPVTSMKLVDSNISQKQRNMAKDSERARVRQGTSERLRITSPNTSKAPSCPSAPPNSSPKQHARPSTTSHIGGKPLTESLTIKEVYRPNSASENVEIEVLLEDVDKSMSPVQPISGRSSLHSPSPTTPDIKMYRKMKDNSRNLEAAANEASIYNLDTSEYNETIKYPAYKRALGGAIPRVAKPKVVPKPYKDVSPVQGAELHITKTELQKYGSSSSSSPDIYDAYARKPRRQLKTEAARVVRSKTPVKSTTKSAMNEVLTVQAKATKPHASVHPDLSVKLDMMDLRSSRSENQEKTRKQKNQIKRKQENGKLYYVSVNSSCPVCMERSTFPKPPDHTFNDQLTAKAPSQNPYNTFNDQLTAKASSQNPYNTFNDQLTAKAPSQNPYNTFNDQLTAKAPSQNPYNTFNDQLTAKAPSQNSDHTFNDQLTAKAPPQNPDHTLNKPLFVKHSKPDVEAVNYKTSSRQECNNPNKQENEHLAPPGNRSWVIENMIALMEGQSNIWETIGNEPRQSQLNSRPRSAGIIGTNQPMPDRIQTDTSQPMPDRIQRDPGTNQPMPDRIQTDTSQPMPDHIQRDPGTNQPMPDHIQRDPGTNQPMPDRIQRDPGTNQPMPDRIQRDPGTNQPMPDHIQRDPGTNQPMPDRIQRDPGTNQPMPDHTQRDPGTNQPMHDRIQTDTSQPMHDRIQRDTSQPMNDQIQTDTSEQLLPQNQTDIQYMSRIDSQLYFKVPGNEQFLPVIGNIVPKKAQFYMSSNGEDIFPSVSQQCSQISLTNTDHTETDISARQPKAPECLTLTKSNVNQISTEESSFSSIDRWAKERPLTSNVEPLPYYGNVGQHNTRGSFSYSHFNHSNHPNVQSSNDNTHPSNLEVYISRRTAYQGDTNGTFARSQLQGADSEPRNNVDPAAINRTVPTHKLINIDKLTNTAHLKSPSGSTDNRKQKNRQSRRQESEKLPVDATGKSKAVGQNDKAEITDNKVRKSPQAPVESPEQINKGKLQGISFKDIIVEMRGNRPRVGDSVNHKFWKSAHLTLKKPANKNCNKNTEYSGENMHQLASAKGRHDTNVYDKDSDGSELREGVTMKGFKMSEDQDPNNEQNAARNSKEDIEAASIPIKYETVGHPRNLRDAVDRYLQDSANCLPSYNKRPIYSQDRQGNDQADKLSPMKTKFLETIEMSVKDQKEEYQYKSNACLRRLSIDKPSPTNSECTLPLLDNIQSFPQRTLRSGVTATPISKTKCNKKDGTKKKTKSKKAETAKKEKFLEMIVADYEASQGNIIESDSGEASQENKESEPGKVVPFDEAESVAVAGELLEETEIPQNDCYVALDQASPQDNGIADKDNQSEAEMHAYPLTKLDLDNSMSQEEGSVPIEMADYADEKNRLPVRHSNAAANNTKAPNRTDRGLGTLITQIPVVRSRFTQEDTDNDIPLDDHYAALIANCKDDLSRLVENSDRAVEYVSNVSNDTDVTGSAITDNMDIPESVKVSEFQKSVKVSEHQDNDVAPVFTITGEEEWSVQDTEGSGLQQDNIEPDDVSLDDIREISVITDTNDEEDLLLFVVDKIGVTYAIPREDPKFADVLNMYQQLTEAAEADKLSSPTVPSSPTDHTDSDGRVPSLGNDEYAFVCSTVLNDVTKDTREDSESVDTCQATDSTSPGGNTGTEGAVESTLPGASTHRSTEASYDELLTIVDGTNISEIVTVDYDVTTEDITDQGDAEGYSDFYENYDYEFEESDLVMDTSYDINSLDDSDLYRGSILTSELKLSDDLDRSHMAQVSKVESIKERIFRSLCKEDDCRNETAADAKGDHTLSDTDTASEVTHEEQDDCAEVETEENRDMLCSTLDNEEYCENHYTTTNLETENDTYEYNEEEKLDKEDEDTSNGQLSEASVIGRVPSTVIDRLVQENVDSCLNPGESYPHVIYIEENACEDLDDTKEYEIEVLVNANVEVSDSLLNSQVSADEETVSDAKVSVREDTSIAVCRQDECDTSEKSVAHKNTHPSTVKADSVSKKRPSKVTKEHKSKSTSLHTSTKEKKCSKKDKLHSDNEKQPKKRATEANPKEAELLGKEVRGTNTKPGPMWPTRSEIDTYLKDCIVNQRAGSITSNDSEYADTYSSGDEYVPEQADMEESDEDTYRDDRSEVITEIGNIYDDVDKINASLGKNTPAKQRAAKKSKHQGVGKGRPRKKEETMQGKKICASTKRTTIGTGESNKVPSQPDRSLKLKIKLTRPLKAALKSYNAAEVNKSKNAIVGKNDSSSKDLIKQSAKSSSKSTESSVPCKENPIQPGDKIVPVVTSNAKMSLKQRIKCRWSAACLEDVQTLVERMQEKEQQETTAIKAEPEEEPPVIANNIATMPQEEPANPVSEGEEAYQPNNERSDVHKSKKSNVHKGEKANNKTTMPQEEPAHSVSDGDQAYPSNNERSNVHKSKKSNVHKGEKAKCKKLNTHKSEKSNVSKGENADLSVVHRSEEPVVSQSETFIENGGGDVIPVTDDESVATVDKSEGKKIKKKSKKTKIADDVEVEIEEDTHMKDQAAAAEGFIQTQLKFMEIIKGSTPAKESTKKSTAAPTGHEEVRQQIESHGPSNEVDVSDNTIANVELPVGIPLLGERVISKAISDAEKAMEGTGKLDEEDDPRLVVEDLINSCVYQLIEDEDHIQLGGIAFFMTFSLPFVFINGYKYTPLKDVVPMFQPNHCVTQCIIPRRVLTKHKTLVKTFSTWDQVYKLELIKNKKGPSVTTGDILVKLNSLIAQIHELINIIVEQHKNTELKKSKNCDVKSYTKLLARLR